MEVFMPFLSITGDEVYYYKNSLEELSIEEDQGIRKIA